MRAVCRSLLVDSWRRAEEAATDIEACLEPSMGGADPRGAHAILNRWFWHASVQTTKPSRADMEKFRVEFQTLYQREEPQLPGLTLGTHVDPAKGNNNIPLEAEVEAAVRRLRPHRAGGHTHLRTEHFK